VQRSGSGSGFGSGSTVKYVRYANLTAERFKRNLLRIRIQIRNWIHHDVFVKNGPESFARGVRRKQCCESSQIGKIVADPDPFQPKCVKLGGRIRIGIKTMPFNTGRNTDGLGIVAAELLIFVDALPVIKA
jgi:hypothetical protein